ncbi:hypothetical protein EJ05DRAFT_121969 [Pseudovirgaria hyperparasitica]|uniref:Uncharacterized protein n=1 Tax=Pseudovirgaria hyperparasitica TaxID=470096 RepID=A0A6A6VZ11_9PEZI|nr:uncharacterized protein EJ05DRAFT_121969 [Pseudovirgaria hyperparasitica]KAF2755086.1 hypothetical protein EJ05DRAFT_121969 [Pseudovirgaria hyperparasitica]
MASHTTTPLLLLHTSHFSNKHSHESCFSAMQQSSTCAPKFTPVQQIESPNFSTPHPAKAIFQVHVTVTSGTCRYVPCSMTIYVGDAHPDRAPLTSRLQLRGCCHIAFNSCSLSSLILWSVQHSCDSGVTLRLRGAKSRLRGEAAQKQRDRVSFSLSVCIMKLASQLRGIGYHITNSL